MGGVLAKPALVEREHVHQPGDVVEAGIPVLCGLKSHVLEVDLVDLQVRGGTGRPGEQ